MKSKRLLLSTGTSVILKFIDKTTGNFVGKHISVNLECPVIVDKKYTTKSNDMTGYMFCVFSIPDRKILDMLSGKSGERLFLYARNEDWKILL